MRDVLRRWLRLGRRDSAPGLSTDRSDQGSPLDGHLSGAPDQVALVREDIASPGDQPGDLATPPETRWSSDAAEARVRDLLSSDAVSASTRIALTTRLDALARPPMVVGSYLSASEVVTLRALSERLVPQADRELRVDLVAAIDARLAADRGDGWRYDALPADNQSLRHGLVGLDQAARELHHTIFADLSADQQDAVLQRVQAGTPPGEMWRSLPADRWFEVVLAECCQTYYADPLSQDEIGYVGYADLPSWQAIGLDQREDRERVAARTSLDLNEGMSGV